MAVLAVLAVLAQIRQFFDNTDGGLGRGALADLVMSEARRLTIVQPQLLTPVLQRVKSVERTEVDWIAYGFLASGKLTVLDGDPGLGKSTLAIDWAAKITRGEELFSGVRDRKPRGVVLISDEDDAGDTIRPRLEVAGADLDKVGLLHFETPEGESLLPEFPRDGEALGDAVEAIDAALVIIDPLMLYLGSEINANRDAEVRRALNPIIKAAQRTGAAVLVLRHFTKGGGANALYRGGGSIAIIGSARIGLMVARDLKADESGQTVVLACFKNNLAPFPPSLSYQLESVTGTQVARVNWMGSTSRTADSLLDTEERTQRDTAEEFLATLLEGGPVSVRDLQREAREAGISWRTIERAKGDLRVRAKKNGYSGSWSWELPPKAAMDAQEPPRPPNGSTVNLRSFAEDRQDRQDRQSGLNGTSNGVVVCADCHLPRGKGGVCPNCGCLDVSVVSEGTEP